MGLGVCMGKLKNAPVFYVVAQVTHSPILKLDSLIPDLQERLRKEGFPGYRAQKQNRVSFRVEDDTDAMLNSKIEQMEFTSHFFSKRDHSESFVISPDNFFLQTVEYDTIDVFKEMFATCIRAVQDILIPDSFTRIGLRFLDAVKPPAEGELSRYIRTQFLGLQDTLDGDWLANYTFSETLLSRGDQQTKVRVITRSSALAMPPDLASIAPSLPARFSEIKGIHALLDSDASFAVSEEKAQEFRMDAILDRLSRLKQDISDSFKAVVTEAALADWE